jgi:hypothetical protein
VPTLPTLPQAQVDVTYSLPGGTTHVCDTTGEFTTALSNAALGDVIELAAGVTFTGPFTLPNKTSGSGWIYIVSSALASLPAYGYRVSPSDASNMPTIQSGGSPHRCILTDAIAHHFRFVGIRFAPAAATATTGLVVIGSGETDAADLPHHIIFDRCVVKGESGINTRRGIAGNGNHFAVINSHISEIKDDGTDSQAVWVYNTEGPILIHNNYLEAAAENVMFGGTDPTITNNVPADITITQNYFFKPLSWIGAGWLVKNILEFKNAKRILVEGNVFENIWLAEQTGYLMNAKSVNQDGGTGIWCTTQDLTFRYNKGLNCENGITVSGDAEPTAVASARFLFEHNVIKVANVNSGDGYGLFNSQGVSPRYLTHFTLRHNTFVGVRHTQFHVEWGSVDGICGTDYDIIDNLFEGGTSGLDGRDSAEGTACLDDRYTNATCRFNCFQGRNSANYGAASGSGNTMSNNFFTATQGAIDFVNYAGGNYALNVTSPLHNAASDSTDVGADVATVEEFAALALSGEPAQEGIALQESMFSTTMEPQKRRVVISTW